MKGAEHIHRRGLLGERLFFHPLSRTIEASKDYDDVTTKQERYSRSHLNGATWMARQGAKVRKDMLGSPRGTSMYAFRNGTMERVGTEVVNLANRTPSCGFGGTYCSFVCCLCEVATLVGL